MKEDDEFFVKITKLCEIMIEQGFCMAKNGLSLDEAKKLNNLIIKICEKIIKR